MYKDGTKLVDTAAGWRGNVDQRPVGPDMLFCGLKMTSAVVATAVHLLVDRGLLRYDDPVSACWPAFGKHGKAEITVRQVPLRCLCLARLLWHVSLTPWLPRDDGYGCTCRLEPSIAHVHTVCDAEIFSEAIFLRQA